MTKEQVLLKLTALCAKCEQCIFDVRKKMQRWQIDEETQNAVIEYLVNERYIDESRYAHAFIKNKIKYNKWGKYKIEQALRLKQIPKELYSQYMPEADDNEYNEVLLSILKQKMKSVKADNDYEKKGKLIRFALQRGFTYDQVQDCIDNLMERKR
jgi:regulatory protein